MFLFGHLGIGSNLVSPFTRGLSKKAVYLGTVFPDLLDKFLYYGMSFIIGKRGEQLGLIRGTRTFGHTALFVLFFVFLGRAKNIKWLDAFSLGLASHLILDFISNCCIGYTNLTHVDLFSQEFFSPFLWPLTGWSFPLTRYHDLKENLLMWRHPFNYYGELLGLIILTWDLIRGVRKGRAYGL